MVSRVVILFLCFLVSTTSPQMFDLSSGKTTLLELECEEIEGEWDVQNAEKYDPNLSGKVLTSGRGEYACLTLKDKVDIQKDTRFHIKVYLGYSSTIFNKDTFIVDIVRGNKWYRWVEISTNSPGWIEESYPLPEGFTNYGKGLVELTSKSIKNTASIRYFALSTELSLTTTTTTQPTTAEPTEPPTESTTAISDTDTTEPITEPTTESTTEPITEPTTESTTETSLEPTSESFEPTTEPIIELTTELTYTEFSNTDTTEPNTEPMNDSTTNDQEEPSTPESTKTEFITNPTTAYVPPHVHNTGFTLDLWSIVVGFCIGLVFVVLAVLFGTCVWWLLFVACSKKDRKPDYNDVALPRLRQRQNYLRPDIRAGYY